MCLLKIRSIHFLKVQGALPFRKRINLYRQSKKVINTRLETVQPKKKLVFTIFSALSVLNMQLLQISIGPLVINVKTIVYGCTSATAGIL